MEARLTLFSQFRAQYCCHPFHLKLKPSTSQPTHFQEIFRKSSYHVNTNKGCVVKQSGNDVEGWRSQKVLFQPNMRVFLHCSVMLRKVTIPSGHIFVFCPDIYSLLWHLFGRFFKSEFLIQDLISRLMVNKNRKNMCQNLSLRFNNQNQIKFRKLKIFLLFNGSLSTLYFFYSPGRSS